MMNKCGLWHSCPFLIYFGLFRSLQLFFIFIVCLLYAIVLISLPVVMTKARLAVTELVMSVFVISI